jgi:hypothetical protein
MSCKTVEDKLTFYLYDELEAGERAAVAAHLESCAACAAALRELERMRAVLDQRPRREPTPELLVRSREALDEALDREAESWRALVRSWFIVPPGVSALRATAALTILVLGFSLGWTLRTRAPAAPTGDGSGPAPWVGSDLSNMRISGISQVTPADRQTGAGAVRITLDAQRRVTLEGSFDDPRIREVLLYAVKNYDNPGIRRDTLEVLGQSGDNPTVREALLYALRRDPNPGVRLEAAEALRELDWGPDLRYALLDALREDQNPGVRVAAVNVLVDHADEEVLPVLEQMAAGDPNTYVRLQCARALRERAREDF